MHNSNLLILGTIRSSDFSLTKFLHDDDQYLGHRNISQRKVSQGKFPNWIRGCRGRVSFLLEPSTHKVWRGEEILTLKTILQLWKEKYKHIWKFSLRIISLLRLHIFYRKFVSYSFIWFYVFILSTVIFERKIKKQWLNERKN